jgi:hypothetical protein
VRDHDHGGSPRGELTKPIQDDAGRVEVERARGFVGENDPRVAGHHAGDGHTLAFPAGKLVGLEVGAVRQVDCLEGRANALLRQGVPGEFGRHRDVFRGGQRGDEVVFLEDETRVLGAESRAFGRFHTGSDGAERGHRTRCGFVEARHAVQQRGLARPRCADHGGETALGEIGVHVVQRDHPRILAARHVVYAGELPDGDSWSLAVSANVGVLDGRRRGGVAHGGCVVFPA